MKKQIFKVIIPIIASVTITLFILTVFFDKNNNTNQEFYNGLPVSYAEVLYAYDTSTKEKAMGISDYAFIAKVEKILRTEYKNPIKVKSGLFRTTVMTDPYTIYRISVIKNIKGNLDTSKPIESIQLGGLNKNGKSYMFAKGESLLNEGEYYLFMTSVWAQKDGEIIEVPQLNRILSLGDSFDINSKDSLDIINKYEQAYKNEIVPSTIEKHISKYDVNYIKE
jgi:hypothetical protein